MIPDYPERLLPQVGNKYIDTFEPLKACYLQRRVSAGFWVEEDGEWVADEAKLKLDLQSGHLADASTNLLGIFRPLDRQYQLTEAGKERYASLWLPDEIVEQPQRSDFNIENSEQLVVKIDDLLTMPPIIYNAGDEKELTAKCQVLHTPKKGNFWHVSLRWINRDGDVLHQKGSWRRRLLTTVRSTLLELGEREPDIVVIISPGHYRNLL